MTTKTSEKAKSRMTQVVERVQVVRHSTHAPFIETDPEHRADDLLAWFDNEGFGPVPVGYTVRMFPELRQDDGRVGLEFQGRGGPFMTADQARAVAAALVKAADIAQNVAERMAALADDTEFVWEAAAVTHEMNLRWCLLHYDMTQLHWGDAPDWQRKSAFLGVKGALRGATPEESHLAWTAAKLADGWVYGEAKDPEKKTHPCLVPYNQLPAAQREKDFLFTQTVRTLALAYLRAKEASR